MTSLLPGPVFPHRQATFVQVFQHPLLGETLASRDRKPPRALQPVSNWIPNAQPMLQDRPQADPAQTKTLDHHSTMQNLANPQPLHLGSTDYRRVDVECLTRKSSPRWTRLLCADFEPYVEQHNRGRGREPSCLEGARTLLRQQRQPLPGHQAYRPIGILTPTPLPGPSTAAAGPTATFPGEILEEIVTVRVYNWTCHKCQRTFHHRDRPTLLHNVEEHQVQRHGENVERLCQLQNLQRQVGRIARDLNRRYGS
jgi:hypothetical protein